jgi:hypothetical protein
MRPPPAANPTDQNVNGQVFNYWSSKSGTLLDATLSPTWLRNCLRMRSKPLWKL